MKNKILMVLNLILISSCFFSCNKKEDGNIDEWVGEYEWTSNYCEHWHHYVVGGKKILSKEEYKKENDHFIIYPDKTWKIPNSKGLGPTGTIRCYKDHINLLGLLMDYGIEEKFDFKFYRETTAESERTFLRYYSDESEGRITGDFDFDIRVVRFWLK